jgi:excisionase family DNA binding protein
MSGHTVNGHVLEKASPASVERLAEPLHPAEYLTPPEAAAIVRVHPKTLERWAARDATLPVLKVGGVVRYPAERFKHWLRSREQGRPAGRQPSSKQLLSARNGAPAKESA